MTIEGSDINDTTILQSHNFKGEAGGRGLSIYNEQSLLTAAESYNKEGAYSGGVKVMYNDRGFASETTFFDEDKNVSGKNIFTYEYDDMGNWVKVICKDPDKGTTIISERVYTYFK
jgi:hypothetical protein